MIDLVGIFHNTSQKCQITRMSSSCSEVIELSGEFGFAVYTILQSPGKKAIESDSAILFLDLLKSAKTFSECRKELEKLAQNNNSTLRLLNSQAEDEDTMEAYAWNDFDNIYLT